MSKIALAAFLLGVFSLSPLAKAEEAAPPAAPAAPADDGLETASSNWDGGMSLGDLKTLSNGTFNVRVVGETMYMDGSIPRKCARGSSLSTNSVAADTAANQASQHQIKFVPGPDCAKLTAADKLDRVKLSSAALFGPSRSIPDNGIDGPVCLLHAADGPNACDSIPKATFTSQATLDAKAKIDQLAKDEAASKRARETAAQERARKEKELVEQLTLACKNGDWANFGAQIEAAKAFLGDVTSVLAKVDTIKKKFMADQISKAKDVDAAKDAYQAFLDAAGEAGWDTDDAAAAYGEKRINLLHAVIADSNKGNSEKAAAIRDVASELRELDLMNSKVGNTGKTGKELMSLAYQAVATKTRDDAGTDTGKLADAERMYRSAEEYGDNAEKARIEAEIAKMYNAAADQCISDAKEKGKGFNSCDTLAKKAKGAMDGAIKAQGRIKGDDSLEALAAMKQEKISRFGVDGYSMNISGYGTMNRMGGSYDVNKYQAYTQAQQQFITQMYMRQSMGGMGVTGGGTGTGGGYFQ